MGRMPELSIDCGPCRLRPFRMDDADSLARHANNPNVSRWLRDRFPFPYTIGDAVEFLEIVMAGTEDAPEFVLAIDIDGAAVGGVGIVRGTDIERVSAELGYWLGEQYWGRGIITAAIRTFAPWAMDRWQLTRLHADVFPQNPASARVLEKAGFHLESIKGKAVIKRGDIYDAHCYVLLK